MLFPGAQLIPAYGHPPEMIPKSNCKSASSPHPLPLLLERSLLNHCFAQLAGRTRSGNRDYQPTLPGLARVAGSSIRIWPGPRRESSHQTPNSLTVNSILPVREDMSLRIRLHTPFTLGKWSELLGWSAGHPLKRWGFFW